MKTLFALTLLVAATAWLGPVHAGKVEALKFSSPDQEERYKSLIKELRCLVCQNQNIADSNAELAQDLRRRTYQMVESGKSEKEIVDFMVDRYGDFVIYRPPVSTSTLLLWSGPFLILVLGVVFLVRTIRRRNAVAATDATVDQATLHQASELLRQRDKENDTK